MKKLKTRRFLVTEFVKLSDELDINYIWTKRRSHLRCTSKYLEEFWSEERSYSYHLGGMGNIYSSNWNSLKILKMSEVHIVHDFAWDLVKFRSEICKKSSKIPGVILKPKCFNFLNIFSRNSLRFPIAFSPILWPNFCNKFKKLKGFGTKEAKMWWRDLDEGAIHYSSLYTYILIISFFSNFQRNSCIRHNWEHHSWLVSLDWSNDSNFNGIDCYNSLLLLLSYWPISSPFWRIRCFQVKIFFRSYYVLF